MNSCEQLHETVVRDIVDIVTSAKDFDQIKWINNKNNVFYNFLQKVVHTN